jgi:predicted transcriptional regulator
MKWPDEYQEIVVDFRRRLKGYWSVGELARFLGVSRTAILMQVNRGKIDPIDGDAGQPVYFTDDEVIRYVTEPYGGGRRRKKPNPTEANDK